jgi:hypothetical protein
MSRKAKGKRPGYFNKPECDKLLPSLSGRAASRPVTAPVNLKSVLQFVPTTSDAGTCCCRLRRLRGRMLSSV